MRAILFALLVAGSAAAQNLVDAGDGVKHPAYLLRNPAAKKELGTT